MLLRSARFFAADKAGRSNAANSAITTITTNSSMSVNARQRLIILKAQVPRNGSVRLGVGKTADERQSGETNDYFGFHHYLVSG